MVNVMINDVPVSVPEGTTIMEAAASAGIEIPNLCYLKDLNEISACRVCCVEIEGEGKLVPSCNNVVGEGMVIHTNSPRVREARRTNVELILSQHDNKCATCVRSGTCQLQKLANDLGVLNIPYPSDLAQGKKATWTTTFPLYRDVNKCIKCMRCVQVCDKVQSLSVWDVSGSGSRTTIDVSGNRFIKESDCSLCGQCITHCPTGALRERDDTARAFSALAAPDKVTVVQIAPAVRTAWGEAFGMDSGAATVGQLVTALRQMGADYVYDTTFSADLTIMEEGTELLHRLQAVQQFSAFLHDSQVGRKGRIIYVIRAHLAQCGHKLPDRCSAAVHAECLAPCSAYGGRDLDNGHLVRCRQRGERPGGVVPLAQRAGRTVGDALAAQRTVGLLDETVARNVDRGARA